LIGEATFLTYLYFKKKREGQEEECTEKDSTDSESSSEESDTMDSMVKNAVDKEKVKPSKPPPPKPPPPRQASTGEKPPKPKPPKPSRSTDGEEKPPQEVPRRPEEKPSTPKPARKSKEEKEKSKEEKDKKKEKREKSREGKEEETKEERRARKEKKRAEKAAAEKAAEEDAPASSAVLNVKTQSKEEVDKVEPEKEKNGNGEENDEKADEEKKEEEAPKSRWGRLMSRSSAMSNSAAAAMAAQKEAAAEKLKATQDSIYQSKESAAAAVTAKKESAAAAAAAKKEAAAAKIKETQDSLWQTKDAATEKISNSTTATKEATGNAAASVNLGFWSAVQAAKKAAVDTKRMMPGQKAETLSILHFNDVYNVESREVEPVGGAARFLTAMKKHQDVNPLVLFSGDIFAPSIMSTFTKGEQMVPVLNKLGVHCAVYGNHDFDFGLETLESLAGRTDFPWLMSNVIDNETGRPLAEGKMHHIIERDGRKIGLIGLVEREWLDTLATINPEEVDFTDYVDAASMLATELKRKGCDYVIALTHMRTPNDIRLAESVPEVDLILGGHDHVYEKRKVNGTYILKSGTDFRQFSMVTLDFREETVGVEVEAINVTKDFEPDPELEALLEKYTDVVEGKMGEVLGHFRCDLDGRFSSVRTAETNLGNLVTDIMVAALNADCALLNSGTLRSDQKHMAGEFILRDLLTILPMMDELILLEVTGKMIHDALENGVSMWPKLEGRFPQVSGITFAFDPSKPPGSRVNPEYVKVGDEYLDMEHRYKLVTKAYLGKGKDGYDSLSGADVLVDEEIAPNLTSAVQNHFQAIQMKQGKADRKISSHHQSLVTLSRKTSVVKALTEEGLIPPNRGISPARSHSPGSDYGKGRSPSGRCKGGVTSVEQLEAAACKLEPRVEGRILQLTPEVERRLKQEKEADLTRLTITEVEEKSSPDSPEDELRSALFSVPGKKKGAKEEASDLK